MRAGQLLDVEEKAPALHARMLGQGQAGDESEVLNRRFEVDEYERTRDDEANDAEPQGPEKASPVTRLPARVRHQMIGSTISGPQEMRGDQPEHQDCPVVVRPGRKAGHETRLVVGRSVGTVEDSHDTREGIDENRQEEAVDARRLRIHGVQRQNG